MALLIRLAQIKEKCEKCKFFELSTPYTFCNELQLFSKKKYNFKLNSITNIELKFTYPNLIQLKLLIIYYAYLI